MSSEFIKILFLLLVCNTARESAGTEDASKSDIPACGSTTSINTEKVLNVTHHTKLKTLNTSASGCVLHFQTDAGHEILMEFTSFGFFNQGDECNPDYLQFGNGEPHETKKYCTSMPTPFRSNENKMFIRYVATKDGTQGFTALLTKKTAVDSITKCPPLIEIKDNYTHDVSHHISKGNLQTGNSCQMNLQTDAAYILKLQIEQLDFSRSDKQCTKNYLKFGDTLEDLSKAFCKTAPKLVVSAGNTFIMQYLAEEHGSNGFKAKVSRMLKPECNKSISLPNNEPVNISHELEKLTLVYNAECTTKISTEQGFEMELQFNDFFMPSEPNACTNAWVKFDSGDPRDTHKYCRETPHKFISEGPSMFLTYFVKDREAYGFTATVRRILAEPIHTDSPPPNGQVTKPPSTGSSSDATGAPNTDEQTTTTLKTTRTFVNPIIMATVLFLLTSF